MTIGVAVESNDLTITIDNTATGESMLRMIQEENPTKTIVKGSFGMYSSQGKDTMWKHLRYTEDLCHHVTNIIIPTKNVDNWEVLSFHATSTAGETGALMVATTTGFLSSDHFKCVVAEPSDVNWYKSTFDDTSWPRAKTIKTTKTNGLVHPHDIVGAAKWIWSSTR